MAFKRVGAARLMRQFPCIYDLLAEGRIHLTALMLLKPHLTAESHEDWLLAACGKSKREVELLVVSRCPRPDVKASVRKLPSVKPAPIPTSASPTLTPSGAKRSVDWPTKSASETMTHPVVSGAVAVTSANASPIADSTKAFGLTAMPTGAAPQVGLTGQVAQAAQVVPLSSSSYRVAFTASAQLKLKLDQARELLSHRIPPSDLPALIERALDQLLEREQTRRYGASPKRQSAASPLKDCSAEPRGQTVEPPLNHDCVSARGEDRSRDSLDPNLARVVDAASTGKNIAVVEAAAEPGAEPRAEVTAAAKPGHRRRPKAAVRRAVFDRDAGQCTFVDGRGRRCEQRHFLELDHIEAHAIGGTEDVSNLRLRCKLCRVRHNAPATTFSKQKDCSVSSASKTPLPTRDSAVGTEPDSPIEQVGEARFAHHACDRRAQNGLIRPNAA